VCSSARTRVNDCGTGVAATEPGRWPAPIARGRLFGNGERTGNASTRDRRAQPYLGVSTPGLDFDIDAVIKTAEYRNQLPVHPRHPYAGELVFTVFSGSHQDAIKKGLRGPGGAQRPDLDVLHSRSIPSDSSAALRGSDPRQLAVGQQGVAWVLEQD
jgi:2-isopropylmalate synthase